jgi:hypothetical protein
MTLVVNSEMLWETQRSLSGVLLRERRDLVPLGLDDRDGAGASLQDGQVYFHVDVGARANGVLHSPTFWCLRTRGGGKTHPHPRPSCTHPTSVPVAASFSLASLS